MSAAVWCLVMCVSVCDIVVGGGVMVMCSVELCGAVYFVLDGCVGG